jgi:hypothetical protein
MGDAGTTGSAVAIEFAWIAHVSKAGKSLSTARVIRDVVAIILIVMLVRVSDPLGIDEALNHQVDDIVARLLSAWYPAKGQDQITVVMIDDTYLTWRHQASSKPKWPLDLSEHGRILARIQEAGARSIFVDMIYATERPGPGASEAFAALIRDIVNGQPGFSPVPVMLADVFGTTMAPRRCGGQPMPNGMVLPDLACAATTVAPVRWQRTSTTYPAERPAWGCGGMWPTPAFAQFAIIDGGPSPRCGTGTEQPPLFVVWGHNISAQMARRPGYEECRYRQDASTVLSGIEVVLRGVFIGFDRQYAERGSNPCLYTDTISAAALFDDTESGKALRKRFISGRHVILGTDIVGETDEAVSPVQGAVPGVYLHAMALDNLLVTRGSKSKRDFPAYQRAGEGTFLGYGIEAWITSFAIAVWVVGEYLSRIAVRAITDRRVRRHGHWKLWLSPGSLSFLVRGIALACVLYGACAAQALDEPAAWNIGLTILIVEVFLKVAMGHFGMEASH